MGLLTCMTGIKQEALLSGNELFVEFKGAMTEQYVLQQLVINPEWNLYYYTNERNSAEVDFLLDNGNEIIPIEVKAEENLKAKSLQMYCQKYKPEKAVRTSMSDYRKEDWLTNIPLYAIAEIGKI